MSFSFAANLMKPLKFENKKNCRFMNVLEIYESKL